MFTWKKISAVFLCLVIIGLSIAAGCGGGGEEEAVPPVKIGAIIPSTGAYASYGPWLKTGIEFVLDEIEEAGGIKSLGGAQIEVAWADDQSSGATAATEYERLVAVEHVRFVIGPVFTGTALNVASLADEYKIPTISLYASGDQLRQLNLTYWRSVTAGTFAGAYGAAFVDFLQYLIDNYDVPHDRIALVFADTTTGKAQRAGALQRLEELGLDGNIVLDQLFSVQAADMTPYALIAKDANPDVVVGYTTPAAGVKLVRAYYDISFYPPIMIGEGSVSNPAQYRTLATPAVYDKLFVEHGAGFGLQSFNDHIGLESCRDAMVRARAWSEAHGIPFDEYLDGFMMAAQAMYALWDALEEAGSAEPEAINEALRNLSIDENDPHFIVPAFAPALEWESYGLIKNYNPLFSQIQDEVEVLVYPEDLKQAEPLFP